MNVLTKFLFWALKIWIFAIATPLRYAMKDMNMILPMCAVLFSNLTAQEDLLTDRPDQTESAIVIKPGFFQLEFGWTFTQDDEAGTETETVEVPGTRLQPRNRSTPPHLRRKGSGRRTSWRHCHPGAWGDSNQTTIYRVPPVDPPPRRFARRYDARGSSDHASPRNCRSGQFPPDASGRFLTHRVHSRTGNRSDLNR